MKKVTSISLSILMLAAMLHLTVATHFCGGEVAGSQISLTGKLASCGMEDSKHGLPLSGFNFTTHCCDDVVTLISIESNYTSSFFHISESFQYNFLLLAIPCEVIVISQTDRNILNTNVSPPGTLMSTNVDLSDICVFRI